MGMILFNGVSSRDHGVIIEEYPELNHGARRGEAYQVAGRNGTFYAEDGTYDNYVQAYKIAVREGLHRRADLRASDLASWLLVPSGFCRLEDSFEPEYFKMARFAGPLNIAQIMGRYGRSTLEFDCLPERWLKTGEREHELTNNQFITNPTPFPSKPIIKIKRTGTINIRVNNDLFMSITEQTNTVIIDCEAETIKTADGTDLYNSTIFYHSYADFPTLQPGVNTVDNTRGSQDTFKLTVIPRWYVL